MKYVLLFGLVFPHLSKGQSTVIGLGNYRIGITTPDSLNRTGFKEEDPSYVKGTIALPCIHIRTFTSAIVKIAGIAVTNVVLVFYDNKLFKLSCDYSGLLEPVFLEQHGPGVRKPVSRFQVCTKEKHKLLLMWGEVWPGVDMLALVVHRKGYMADCKPEEGARLVIADQRISALSSECDVKPTDPLIEEFIKAQTNKPGTQR